MDAIVRVRTLEEAFNRSKVVLTVSIDFDNTFDNALDLYMRIFAVPLGANVPSFNCRGLLDV